ncbi:MAG: ABC transporter ATP-binding protein [Pseudomonadota bacterium]
MSAPAVALKGVSKRFGAVQANRDVDLTVEAGTIHGIIGENGAGKSTLVSILYGFYHADSGEIVVDGQPARFEGAADAIAHGIGMVHQHFMLVPNLSVLENVMLGAEGGPFLAEGKKAARAELQRLARDFGLVVEPDAIVGDLPVGLQQRVEILKALSRGAKILILDEPTGVLTPEETDRFFDILRALRGQGVTVLLITHKLREIMEVTDHVSVMRQGEMVAHRVTAETSRAELASLMVGREVALDGEWHPAEAAGDALVADGLSWRDAGGVLRLDRVSLTIRAGEILGIAGVSGNGQSELLDLLSGIERLQEGRLIIGNRVVDPDDPADPAEMRGLGLAHVPEDRHRRGLVLPFDARENAVLGYHDGPNAGPGRLLSPATLQQHCAALMERFDVRPPGPRLRASGFSGGNQQKLVLAREIETRPRILLVGQPTRGVDIGAIEFIHRAIVSLRDEGCAILLVSVELDEIMMLADRIAVMSAGRITGVIDRAEADTAQIGLILEYVPRHSLRIPICVSELSVHVCKKLTSDR